MSGLPPELIAQLLAKDQQRASGRRNPGGRTAKGKGVDTTTRDYKTWFALNHEMLDKETDEHLHCENPNCIDPRPKAPVVVLVNEKYMCRHCFLAGWLLVDIGQLEIEG